MSQRHKWALMCQETNDLCILARYLNGSTLEVVSEGGMPHMDPAVRLIAHQIAFAGNGDVAFTPLYGKALAFCEKAALEGPNYRPLENNVPIPEIKQS